MRVLVCGGRSYRDWDTFLRVMEKVNPSFIISGGANGADSMAYHYAKVKGLGHSIRPANWNKYGKSAGMIRNEEMLEDRPDQVIAFPGGKGTENMVELAKKAGISVKDLRRALESRCTCESNRC